MSLTAIEPYPLVLADPPWQQTKGGLRAARPNQGKTLDYSTLSLNEIELHISQFCAEECTFFLWTIDKFLHRAESLAISLGFKLHARLIWDKENGIAPAFTVRFAHEYLLWMYRGKFQSIDTSMRGKATTVLREKSIKHSQKPECSYQLIEKLFPTTRKIELYARRQRDGWDSWGDEIGVNL